MTCFFYPKGEIKIPPLERVIRSIGGGLFRVKPAQAGAGAIIDHSYSSDSKSCKISLKIGF